MVLKNKKNNPANREAQARLLDGAVGGEVGPLLLESALLLEVAGENLLEFDPSLGASGAKQLAVELALGLAKGGQRCIESPAVGAGDDEVGVEGFEGAAVELVEVLSRSRSRQNTAPLSK